MKFWAWSVKGEVSGKATDLPRGRGREEGSRAAKIIFFVWYFDFFRTKLSYKQRNCSCISYHTGPPIQILAWGGQVPTPHRGDKEPMGGIAA